MGCDIHVYVEYSKDGKYWKSLTDNAGSRNYVMFGVLAGVRADEYKLYDPKGLPDGELSYVTYGAHWLNVAPDEHPDWAGTDGWTSKANAERWVKNGYSEAEIVDGKLKRVSNPDGHSHSWLSTEELSAALDKYRSIIGGVWPTEAGTVPTEWAAILGAMQAIEANGETARVIFWFDN